MTITAGAIERLSTALADRYRIERELGQGGMATVYLAQDLKHDRKVALKVLKPELAAVLGAERFVVEIKTTAALQHPNILPLFDSGSADGFLYYVMPFIDGETLRSRLNRETQLPVPEAVRITSEVADALDYAHRHGVIHRDIKPENILLHDGRPMVADFGIALAVSAAAGGRMTETGLSLGTPHYMSPEQATADKEITGRSDVYSLASVLYEMLAGQPPHLGGSAQQIIMKIVAEPVELVTKHRKAVPPHVAAALAQALEKLPADRFESARAFKDALANPAFATGTTAGYAGAARPGVSRRTFALTAALGGVAVVAAVWGWLKPQAAPPVTRFQVGLGEGHQLAPRNSLRLAISPDGRKLVYLPAAELPGSSRLYLRRLDQLTAEPLPGTEGAINPAFSPDGNRLAFVQGTPRALKVISLTGGPPLTLTDSLVDQGGVSWNSDGYIYYDGHLEGDGLARIRDTGGSPEIASTPADATESWHALPSALPEGRGVLFVVSRDRGASPYDVAVLDSRTGRHTVLFRGNSPVYAGSGHLLYATEDGSLMAVRFDLERLTVSGDPIPIADKVAVRGFGRADITISNTGTLAYISGTTMSRRRELVWVSREGVATPVDSSWSGIMVTPPALSPDGRRVAVTLQSEARFEIWVKELDRGPAVKLVDQGGYPAWSPDGREIAYTSRAGVLVGPADGSTLPKMRFPRDAQINSLRFSPDGAWLVGNSLGNLEAIPMTGEPATRQLVATQATERRPTISPDGRWLAYESDESGVWQIYVRPFPAVETAKRQVSTTAGFGPVWNPNGRELLYLDADLQLVSVPVSLSPTFSTGVSKVLFPTAPLGVPPMGLDLHPDGTRFLMTRILGENRDASDEMVVVQNVFQELRAKLP